MGCASSTPSHTVQPQPSSFHSANILSPNPLAILPDALSQPSILLSPSLYASQYNDSSDNIELMSPTSAAAFSPPISQHHTNSIITDTEPTSVLCTNGNKPYRTVRQHSVSHAFSDAQHACVDDDDELYANNNHQSSIYSDMDIYIQEFKNTIGLQPNKQTLHYDDVKMLITKLHIPSIRSVQHIILNVLKHDHDPLTNIKLNKITYSQLISAYNDVIAKYSVRSSNTRTDESIKRSSVPNHHESGNHLLSIRASTKSTSNNNNLRRSISSKVRQLDSNGNNITDYNITRQLQYQFSLCVSSTSQTISLSNAIQIIRSNYHPPVKQIDTIMNFFDIDNNKVITEPEFINAIKRLRRHREMKQRYKGKLYEQSAQAKHQPQSSVTYSHMDRRDLVHTINNNDNTNELSRMSRIEDSTNRAQHTSSAINSIRRLSNGTITHSFIDNNHTLSEANNDIEPISPSPQQHNRSTTDAPLSPRQQLDKRSARNSHYVERQMRDGMKNYHRTSVSYQADSMGTYEPMSAPASVDNVMNHVDEVT